MNVYHNPWAKLSSEEFFTTEARPTPHAGCEIYHVTTNQYDVVKAGVCISQRVGLSGAKEAAESVADLLCPTFQDVHDRMLERHGHI